MRTSSCSTTSSLRTVRCWRAAIYGPRAWEAFEEFAGPSAGQAAAVAAG